MMGGGAIFWMSKKQSVVATSSTEAEYYALSEVVKEALWLRNLLIELGFRIGKPFEIKQDNQSTIAIAMNPVSHSKVKHIDIRHHFLRHHVRNGDVELAYCPTENMIADVLTKALPPKQHWKLITMMGMRRFTDVASGKQAHVSFVVSNSKS